MKTNSSKVSYTECSGTKLTPEQRAQLIDAAQAAGMPEGQFVRHLILNALDISPATRLVVVAQAIGEERVRLMLEMVQAAKPIGSPDVRASIERAAFAAGVQLAERRIAELLSVRLELPQ